MSIRDRDDRNSAGEGSAAFGDEARFRTTILDTIASLVLVLDREGRIVLFNRACERVTGYTFDEVRGRYPWDLFILPDEVERVRSVFGKLRAGQSNSYDNAWRTKDGRVREIAWTNTILGDEDGNVAWIVPTGIDVTERRAAERKMLESQARYRALFDGGADAVFVSEVAAPGDLRIVEANGEALRRLGHGRDEMLRLRLPDVLPDDGDGYARLLDRAAAPKGIVFETIERHRDESTLPVEVSAHLVELEGRPVVLATARDLSVRKRLQEELAQASRLEAIGRLAGGVAHDFNNLLVVILSGTDAVREALPPESPLRADLEQVHDAGHKAAGLTRQLLAFGRKQVSRPVAVDVNAVVGDMVKLLQRLLGEGIELEVRLARAACTVLADPAGLQQAIVNLAVNARDAMPGGGRIVIATEGLDVAAADAHASGRPAGSWVAVSVADTGVGMSEDVRRRAFEPFFTTKSEGRGTGLGLASVFGTIAQAGGHVTVDSAPEAGSRFEILLPRISREPESAQAPARKALPRGDGLTVLVVEDDPAVLGIVVRMLEEEGYAVLAEGDPREALSRAAGFGGRIDILLTDVIMPHMNGRVLAEQLRASRPGAEIVFMSGHTGDVIAKAGSLEPGVLFVAKPFTRSDLLDRVAEAAGRAGRQGRP